MTGTNLNDHARDRLREELESLRSQREAVTEELDDLDTAGDRMDDAETLRRRDDAAMLDDRIAELTRLLAGGHPVSPEPDDGDLPSGTEVTLRNPDGSQETLRAVAITEEVAPGEEDSTLTVDSPLGQALAGHQAGDTVRIDTPDGTREVEIVDIRPPE